jgi:hypothetical protein
LIDGEVLDRREPTRLYGIVAMEAFGHLRWAVSDVTPLFEIEIRRFVRTLSGADHGTAD